VAGPAGSSAATRSSHLSGLDATAESPAPGKAAAAPTAMPVAAAAGTHAVSSKPPVAQSKRKPTGSKAVLDAAVALTAVLGVHSAAAAPVAKPAAAKTAPRRKKRVVIEDSEEDEEEDDDESDPSEGNGVSGDDDYVLSPAVAPKVTLHLVHAAYHTCFF
jgi:hypothetical protein